MRNTPVLGETRHRKTGEERPYSNAKYDKFAKLAEIRLQLKCRVSIVMRNGGGGGGGTTHWIRQRAVYLCRRSNCVFNVNRNNSVNRTTAENNQPFDAKETPRCLCDPTASTTNVFFKRENYEPATTSRLNGNYVRHAKHRAKVISNTLSVRNKRRWRRIKLEKKTT